MPKAAQVLTFPNHGTFGGQGTPNHLREHQHNRSTATPHRGRIPTPPGQDRWIGPRIRSRNREHMWLLSSRDSGADRRQIKAAIGQRKAPADRQLKEKSSLGFTSSQTNTYRAGKRQQQALSQSLRIEGAFFFAQLRNAGTISRRPRAFAISWYQLTSWSCWATVSLAFVEFQSSSSR